MQGHWCWVFVCVLLYGCGCQRQPDAPTSVREEHSTDKGPVQPPEKKVAASIDITDLLDALQMNIWKARVHEDGSERIRRVALHVKPKGSNPTELLAVDLPDQQPGTLLVWLQTAENSRYKVGIAYRGDNGRSGSTWKLMDDPFADVVGVKTESSAGIGRPGIIVLKSSGTRGGSDITQQDSVAIYLKNE